MLRQYEYPAYQKQSAPPAQSVALVRRIPVVLYGAGNVNGPRAPSAGRNAAICCGVNRGRRAGDPAVSINPPPDGGGGLTPSTASRTVVPMLPSDVSRISGYCGT